MSGTPFKEKDFCGDGETFTETNRIDYDIEGIAGDDPEEDIRNSFWAVDEIGQGRWHEIDDVSERDRPFVKEGSKLVEIYGKFVSRAGTINHGSFWVVKEWPR